jgi:hypothetical protein
MATREALENACELMGAVTAWVARHDASGCNAVMRLDPGFWIDSELHSALEIMALAWPRGAVHVKSWKGDTLLFTTFAAGRDAGGCVYSMGMLFSGRFELTERGGGMVEGLRCFLQAFFGRSLPETHLNSLTRIPAQDVVCACCRRTPSPKYGWMHWDDLRFIETGYASSHTVCEHCALELYEDVLRGKD